MKGRNEMNQRMKYSEQMKRYRLSIIAHVRLELEGEAKNEEEIRRKVVVQACPIAGTESLLGYFDLDSEFVYDPHEIRWESRRDAIHIESLQDCTHEYRYATFDSEHVRRYEITIAEQYRFELEVQARSDLRRKIRPPTGLATLPMRTDFLDTATDTTISHMCSAKFVGNSWNLRATEMLKKIKSCIEKRGRANETDSQAKRLASERRSN